MGSFQGDCCHQPSRAPQGGAAANTGAGALLGRTRGARLTPRCPTAHWVSLLFNRPRGLDLIRCFLLVRAKDDVGFRLNFPTGVLAFSAVEPSLHSWGKPTGLLCVAVLPARVLLIQPVNVSPRNFASGFVKVNDRVPHVVWVWFCAEQGSPWSPSPSFRKPLVSV